MECYNPPADFIAYGTWTPVLNFSGGAGTLTYTSQIGSFTRIGNLVILQGDIVINQVGTANGTFDIQTFPWEPDDQLKDPFDYNQYPPMIYINGVLYTGCPCFATLDGYAQLNTAYLTEAGALVYLTAANLSNGCRISFAQIYYTDFP